MLEDGELQEGLGGSMRDSTSATKSTEVFKSFLFRREEIDSKEVMKVSIYCYLQSFYQFHPLEIMA